MSTRRGRGGIVLSLGVVLASMSVACGGGSNPDAGTDGGAGKDGAAGADGAAGTDGGVTGPATLLEFCTRFQDLSAAYSARCHGGAKEDWAASADGFVTCAQFMQRSDAGRVAYHRELAQACLDSYGPQRGCSEQDQLCFAKVIEGTTAYGQPCHSDFDCAAEGVCWAETEFAYNACVPTVCAKFPTHLGESCTDFGFCFGMSCIDEECVEYAKVGARCGDGLPSCALGTYCDVDSAKCVLRRADGPCQRDDQCLSTHACVAQTCKPRLALGAPCIGSETACARFTSCGFVSGVCEAAGRVGQQCAETDGTYLCVNGSCRLDADGVPTCYAKGDVGAECTSGDQCVSEGCYNGQCKACGG